MKQDAIRLGLPPYDKKEKDEAPKDVKPKTVEQPIDYNTYTKEQLKAEAARLDIKQRTGESKGMLLRRVKRAALKKITG